MPNTNFNCLRCNVALANEFQLIFDETGIELQLDKLLAEHFKIYVVREPDVTQALCDECVNKLIELYDTKVYKEEILESVELENDESNHTEMDIKKVEEAPSNDGDEAGEGDNVIIEEEIDYEELIEESTTFTDNEEFFGIKESEGINEEEFGEITDEDSVNYQDYLGNVIKSDLERTAFDQNSVCRLCKDSLNSHNNVLAHVLESHQTESEQYPCIFCDEPTKNFDSIANLAYHIVLKHYDLNSIEIYCICPECNSRFSSFLECNKHSCYKKNVGSRLQQDCDKCSKKFISNKRYRFHLQFHLKKQRPKVCFICDILFSDENDFFEHIMFAHEKDNSFVCKKCDRVCSSKELYDNHMKLHDAVRSFHCPHCSKSYFYNQMLTNHIQTHHSNEQSHECKICNKSLANKHLLKRHMQLVHLEETENDVFVCLACGLIGISEDDKMFHKDDDKCPGAEVSIECLKIAYACEFCELAFKSVQNLKEHRSAIHDDNVFKCWICESTYSEYKKLKTHILTHAIIEPIQKSFPINRHYVCNVDSCDKTYLTWPSLRAHKSRHATKYNCDVCTQTFTTESKLNTHLKAHDNNEEYPCQFCSKLCTSQMSLSVHIARKHNNNSEICPICKSTLNSEDALKEHIENLHTEVTCEECGKVTKNKRNLAVHIQMIHGQVKRFFCSVCEKGYFNNSDLKTHERTAHIEPNKFKCQYCNFSSSYEASFKAHLLKHDQNKPFKCQECSREFTRRACYKLHLLRHSDNKPFVCPVELCGRSFVMPGILNSHIKNAHPECKESKVKRNMSQQRLGKRKRINQKPIKEDLEAGNSSDYVITEVYSESEYLDEEGGDIVIFDGTEAEEEIILTEENMYIE
ncbi:zinc finger protein 569 [Eupeodes corollae]|uniref:zinc finger protein 569 n=1 Tax=Eupeodes corollae TaxID=290404 RepID=UPI0024915782|nr:zinc finger protein 569 [Eupeodes corollae]